MESLLGGIKWMLGLEPGDATPNPDVSSAAGSQGQEPTSKRPKNE